MNVVFSSSESYAKCTGVAICSLLVTNTELKELNIYVIITDMTIENQTKIYNMVSNYGRTISFIHADNILKNAQYELGLTAFKGGLNTYARAIANKVMPSNVDKALFVDSDIVFNGSLKDIEELEMELTIIAGVPEVMLMTKFVCYEDVELLEQCSNYVNYGVVYVNLKNWRRFDGDEMIKQCVISYGKKFHIAEQSILNLTFKDYTEVLPCNYNYYTMLHGVSYETLMKRYPRRKLFSKKEVQEAAENPIIIHFVGDYFNRPWYKNNICKYNDTYEKYYKLSPWCDEELDDIPDGISIIFKIYYSILIYLKKNQYDEMYFKLRYIWIQWIRERIPSIDRIKRKK